jgi:hypothetical protein
MNIVNNTFGSATQGVFIYRTLDRLFGFGGFVCFDKRFQNGEADIGILAVLRHNNIYRVAESFLVNRHRGYILSTI